MVVPSIITGRMAVVPAAITARMAVAAASFPATAQVDYADLLRGFALAASPLISPTPGTDDALQVQELHPVEIGGGVIRWFWSGWSNVTATASGIWTATSTTSAPLLLTGTQQVITSTAASAATSGGLNYLRCSDADYHRGTFTLFLNGTANCYRATSAAGTSFTIHATPVLTQNGQGVVDDSAPTLLSSYRSGSRLLGVYSTSSGSTDARYRRAVSDNDGATWVKSGGSPLLAPSGTASGGMEYHHIFRYGNRLATSFEGYNGTEWGGHVGYSPVIVGEDEEAAFNGTWTYLGSRVAVKDAATSWATAHVATPVIHRIGGQTYVFCQGSNTTSPQTGNGGPWYLGYGVLRPA